MIDDIRKRLKDFDSLISQGNRSVKKMPSGTRQWMAGVNLYSEMQRLRDALAYVIEEIPPEQLAKVHEIIVGTGGDDEDSEESLKPKTSELPIDPKTGRPVEIAEHTRLILETPEELNRLLPGRGSQSKFAKGWAWFAKLWRQW